MADLNAPGVFVQVKISEDTEKGRFNDALYYTYKDYDGMKDDQVDADKQARVDGWLSFLDTQSKIVPVEPTVEELTKMKTDLETQVAEVDAQIAAKQ